MFLHWFISQTWREACAARARGRHLLAARRDELPAAAVAAVQTALEELSGAMADGRVERVRLKMEALEWTVKERISPYWHPVWRGNLEVFLVALVVALGIRTFFLQPFKIPTGSMQPTLYGVTFNNLLVRKDLPIPTGWARVRAWLAGDSYVRVLARADGMVERPAGPGWRVLGFNLRQTFTIGGVEHVVWFPPDLGDNQRGIGPLIWRAMMSGHVYHKGEEVISLRHRSGDYLLADRLTYNFRKPARGEIIVFKTTGIDEVARERNNLTADDFFIKRLVALPGERVQIGDDGHLIINGRRLEAGTPHFARVYGSCAGPVPEEDRYWGHVNGTVARQFELPTDPPPLFPDQNAVYAVGLGMYLAMGDNTLNSQDSRFWGALDGEAIVGKCCFVFWPLTRRFGWGND